MKKLAVLLLGVLLLALCACSDPAAVDIERIDKEETYPDGTFSLTHEFDSVDEIYDYSQLVVECEVISTEVVMLDGFPQTWSEVSVIQTIKGTAPDASLTVVEEGGVSDEIGSAIVGVPPLEVGQHLVLFLIDSGLGDGSYCVSGAFQGKFIEREGYYFQQATEGVKLSADAYTPQELPELIAALDAVS